MNILSAEKLISVQNKLVKNLKIFQRDLQIKKLRFIKARQGCPFQGFCPYDVSEPFDCNNCPNK